MKQKNIQIPQELFLELCNYHLGGENLRTLDREQRIQQGLSDKLDAIKRRSDYRQNRRVSNE